MNLNNKPVSAFFNDFKPVGKPKLLPNKWYVGYVRPPHSWVFDGPWDSEEAWREQMKNEGRKPPYLCAASLARGEWWIAQGVVELTK